MIKNYASVLSNIKSTGVKLLYGQQKPRDGHEDIMIKNNADGYTYSISDEEMIDRILILGTNGNTYYSSAEKLTSEAIDFINKMVKDGKGEMIINKVAHVYETGNAPKQDTVMFVLSMLTQSTIPINVRKLGYKIVSKLRTFSQLYMWIGIRKNLGGTKSFGKGVRNALYELFSSKTGDQLALQSTKYKSRKCGKEDWAIQDVIKCAHITSNKLSPESQLVMSYLIKNMEKAEEDFKKYESDPKCIAVMQYLRAVEAVKLDTCTSDTAIQLIRQHRLPREVLNTKLLNDCNVWKALLFTTTVGEKGKIIRKVTMPITALIRNLGVMSQRELFEDEEIVDLVSNYLKNKNVLKYGRVHPVALLVAKLTYQTGKGLKGKLSWKVNNKIKQALEDAFYEAFGNIEGTGKRILHGVDASGSMRSAMCAVPNITASQAVATLVMEAIKREDKYHKMNLEKGEESNFVQDVLIFDTGGVFVNVKPENSLDQVINITNVNNGGGTDCSLPMTKAIDLYNSSGGKKGLYDLFIVYTDNETYYGNIHPSDALDKYRKLTNIDAKMVVVATTPTLNTIGYGYGGYGRKNILDKTDPKNNSPLALNVVGFDLNAPTLIRNFTIGNINIQKPDEISTEVNTDTYDVKEENDFVMVEDEM